MEEQWHQGLEGEALEHLPVLPAAAVDDVSEQEDGSSAHRGLLLQGWGALSRRLPPAHHAPSLPFLSGPQTRGGRGALTPARQTVDRTPAPR